MKVPQQPLFTVEIVNEEWGYKGWVAVHSIGAHGSCGGMRLYPDVTETEAQLLARAMTCKYAFFGKKLGGAKGGYQLPFDLSPEQRKRALNELGHHLAPLLRTGIYQPWTDMNSSNDDIAAMIEGAGMIYEGAIVDSSYYTSLSTFAGILAVAEYERLAPGECNVTIEGLGNVGAHLAEEMKQWGGKLIGCSTRNGGVVNLDGLDVDELIAARRQHGDSWTKASGNWEEIPVEQLFELPMNIHVPCARVHSISPERARKINARAVVPAANVPCTPEAEQVFIAKGINLLPDFIINGGGITGSSLDDLGYSEAGIREIFVDDFRSMLIRLLKLSIARKASPVEVAMTQVEENYQTLVDSYYAPVSLYQRGIKALQEHKLLPKMGTGNQEAKRLIHLIRGIFPLDHIEEKPVKPTVIT